MGPAEKAKSGRRHRRPAAERDARPAADAAFVDNRPEAIAQRGLADAINQSPQVAAQRALSADIHDSPYGIAQRKQLAAVSREAVQLEGNLEEEELLQGKFDPIQRQSPEDEELLQGKFAPVQRQGVPEQDELLQGRFATAQRQAPEEEEPLQGRFANEPAPAQREGVSDTSGNRTGMPDRLKTGLENLSGMDLSGVRVHYNSARPTQLQAHAYTQGQDIHVAPGQEKHLPHEGWHAVQQKQGRVRPTMQMKHGIPVNNDEHLEHEADAMGAKALSEEGQKHEAGSGPIHGGDGHAAPALQARFVAPLVEQNFPDIQAALERDYENVPKWWKIKRLHTDSDEEYSTLEDLAGALKLERKAGKSPASKSSLEGKVPKRPSRKPPPRKRGTSGLRSAPIDKPEKLTVSVSKQKGLSKKTESGSMSVPKLPTLWLPPKDGRQVLKDRDDLVDASLGGTKYRIKAGQNYLNTELSKQYQSDANSIKGNTPTLSLSRQGKDVLVLGDGHHRFVWSAYHGRSFDVKLDKKYGAFGMSWQSMFYRPTPEKLQIKPIVLDDKVKEDFYFCYVTLEPYYAKSRLQAGGDVDRFVTLLCKAKKLSCDEDSHGELAAYIRQRQSVSKVTSYDQVVESLAKKAKDKNLAKKYMEQLKGIKFGKQKPAVVLGPASTTGHFNSVYNVITLDASKMPTADEQLDTLLFESQNAKQKGELYKAKQSKRKGATAKVEYDTDRMYVEGLKAIHGCKDYAALVAQLGIPEKLLEFATYKKNTEVPMPKPSVLSSQDERQALWWYKTSKWSDEQRKAIWMFSKHGIGMGSTYETYK